MELLSSLKPLFTAAIVILLTPIGQELIPCVVKNYLVSICGKYFFTPQLSLLIEWYSIIIEHPATFEKLAMDPEPKRRLIDDLDRFVKRKEWYKKVGRAWKREYNLDISRIKSDSDLKRILLSISNRSMTVIEDIDCVLLEKRGEEKKENYAEVCILPIKTSCK